MNRKSGSRAVTLDECERALIVAAELVDLYGEIYLPLFERLEEGLIELERRGSATDRARELAKSGDLAAYRKMRETR
jgi:hypothetical protein